MLARLQGVVVSWLPSPRNRSPPPPTASKHSDSKSDRGASKAPPQSPATTPTPAKGEVWSKGNKRKEGAVAEAGSGEEEAEAPASTATPLSPSVPRRQPPLPRRHPPVPRSSVVGQGGEAAAARGGGP